MNHLLEILTKHYYIDTPFQEDIIIAEHDKINFWREETIMFLFKNNKLNETIEVNTFKNCIGKKYYKYLLIFSICSPSPVRVDEHILSISYKEIRKLERKIDNTKNEILKKYHIFCYLIAMCDLTQELYDIKIIWYLLNVNKVIFRNNFYL